MNIGQIAKMAQQMQTQMAQAQEELKQTTLEATAGGGAVRVVITGAQELRAIEIDPSAIDPDEAEMLQDLVMTAVNEAIGRSKQLERDDHGNRIRDRRPDRHQSDRRHRRGRLRGTLEAVHPQPGSKRIGVGCQRARLRERA